MNSEYYTPKVEEFHVGITFQENWSSEGKSWQEVKITNAKELAYWMDTYAFDSSPENYRIKRIKEKV
jgi:hypothetical protein